MQRLLRGAQGPAGLCRVEVRLLELPMTARATRGCVTTDMVKAEMALAREEDRATGTQRNKFGIMQLAIMKNFLKVPI